MRRLFKNIWSKANQSPSSLKILPRTSSIWKGVMSTFCFYSGCFNFPKPFLFSDKNHFMQIWLSEDRDGELIGCIGLKTIKKKQDSSTVSDHRINIHHFFTSFLSFFFASIMKLVVSVSQLNTAGKELGNNYSIT
jgi:hypothetical protein